MKKRIILPTVALLAFNAVATILPNANLISTTPNIAYAQEIPDNYYTDEQGTFRVMVRTTKNKVDIKANPFPWAKSYLTVGKDELFNYRGNNYGYYLVARGKDFGNDKGNYTGYIANRNAEVVKLYTDGRIVVK